MNIGGSLGLIGLGAILAFAVTANTSVFNVHTAGYVIMLVGIAGLVIGLRRRDRGGRGGRGQWVGSRVLVRRVRSRPGSQGAIGSHVTRNPIRAGLPRGDGAAAAKTGQASARDIEVIEDVYEQ